MRAIPLIISLTAVMATSGCGGPRERDPDPDADVEAECSSSGHCPSDEVCVDGLCVSAWDRTYRVAVTHVSVSHSHNPDGEGWDEDETPPDLYVCLTFGWQEEAEEFCTDPETDAYEPWYGAWDIEPVLSEGEYLAVELCDDDGETDQCWTVAEVSVPLTALRAESISFLPDDAARLDDYTVTLSFLPL